MKKIEVVVKINTGEEFIEITFFHLKDDKTSPDEFFGSLRNRAKSILKPDLKYKTFEINAIERG